MTREGVLMIFNINKGMLEVFSPLDVVFFFDSAGAA